MFLSLSTLNSAQAYFVYYFIGGVVFFPFLNFIGIFVVFALGADDVFVAVDKWKNARNELPSGTTEQVAALALPDAAYSMLLTSLTTAVAFFGTAICPGEWPAVVKFFLLANCTILISAALQLAPSCASLSSSGFSSHLTTS